MTISKEYLHIQLESAVEARLSALNLFHLRDGVVQTIELLLAKLDEPEPTAEPKGDSKKFPPLTGSARSSDIDPDYSDSGESDTNSLAEMNKLTAKVLSESFLLPAGAQINPEDHQ